MLSTDTINVFPINDAPGAVVTVMDTSNVKHVMIAGQIKKWNGQLVGVNLVDLRRWASASRDAFFGRVKAGFPAYSPSLFDSCCVPLNRTRTLVRSPEIGNGAIGVRGKEGTPLFPCSEAFRV